MTTAQLRQDEETLVRETVAAIPLPPEIKVNRVFLGPDHDGDLSWHIYFDIPPQPRASGRLLESMSRVRDQVHVRVRELGTEKFPYVHFKVPR